MAGHVRTQGWGTATIDDIKRIENETFHPVRMSFKGFWALVCLSPWLCLVLWGVANLVGLA